MSILSYVYVGVFVVAIYPVTREIAYAQRMEWERQAPPDFGWWAIGALLGTIACLLWPLVVAGGTVFLLSRALWTVTLGRDADQPDRERIK